MVIVVPQLKKQAIAWVVLIVGGVASWILVKNENTAASLHLLVAVLLFIAFAKVYLVGRYFMHLNTAPAGLHIAFTAYVIGTYAAVTGIYLSA